MQTANVQLPKQLSLLQITALNHYVQWFCNMISRILLYSQCQINISMHCLSITVKTTQIL